MVYSIGARLGGGGIGTTSYHAAHYLSRSGLLKRLLASSIAPGGISASLTKSMGLPGRLLRRLASLDRRGNLEAATDSLYDSWASRQIVTSDIFHGWNHHCLRSLRVARGLGAVTFVERASSHILTAKALLEEEAARFGIPAPSIPQSSIERALAELAEADHILVPSTFAQQSFLRHGFHPDKLTTIPFGVNCRRFTPAEKHDDVFRVLFVGQISLRKGAQYLLQAWHSLALPQAELVMAGQVKPDMAKLLARLPLNGVKLLGYVTDVTSLYHQASAFALPSIEEGSALVTYEAMACGIPVIVTYNTGSVARDGIDGFVIPVRDPDAIAQRILQLYQDKELRREMGQAARQRAQEHTWERYGQRLVAAYDKALGQRAGQNGNG